MRRYQDEQQSRFTKKGQIVLNDTICITYRYNLYYLSQTVGVKHKNTQLHRPSRSRGCGVEKSSPRRLAKRVPGCFRPGSNRRPCACEAHVITTTLRKQYIKIDCSFCQMPLGYVPSFISIRIFSCQVEGCLDYLNPFILQVICTFLCQFFSFSNSCRIITAIKSFSANDKCLY